MNVEKNYDKHFCFYITASDMCTVLSTDENTLVQWNPYKRQNTLKQFFFYFLFIYLIIFWYMKIYIKYFPMIFFKNLAELN